MKQFDFNNIEISHANKKELALINHFVQSLVSYKKLTLNILEIKFDDSKCAMIFILQALYYGLTLTKESQQKAKKTILQIFEKSYKLNEREQCLILIILALVNNQYYTQLQYHQKYNENWPQDTLQIPLLHLVNIILPDKSLEIFELMSKVKKTQTENCDLLSEESFNLFIQQEYTGSSQLLKQTLSIKPKHPLGLFLHSQFYRSEGQQRKGIVLLENHIQHWNKYNEIINLYNWFLLAIMYIELEQYDKAFLIYSDQINKLDNHFALVQFYKAVLLWSLTISNFPISSTHWQQFNEEINTHIVSLPNSIPMKIKLADNIEDLSLLTNNFLIYNPSWIHSIAETYIRHT